MTNQEINEAVARKLGWTYSERDKHWHERTGESGGNCWDFPDFATSIEAAWEIVDKQPRPMILSREMDAYSLEIYWKCSFLDYRADADTAPLAICQAFLKLP